MKRILILDIISSLFIILFLYTGIYKLLYQEPFLTALEKQPLLRNFSGFVSIFIPLLEVVIAIGLLISIINDNYLLRKRGLICTLLLMTIFTLYVGYMLIEYPNDLPCSCGGIIQQMSWHQHLYFNMAFTLLALLGLTMNVKMKRSSSKTSLIS
jgi:hypothetical protein